MQLCEGHFHLVLMSKEIINLLTFGWARRGNATLGSIWKRKKNNFKPKLKSVKNVERSKNIFLWEFIVHLCEQNSVLRCWTTWESYLHLSSHHNSPDRENFQTYLEIWFKNSVVPFKEKCMQLFCIIPHTCNFTISSIGYGQPDLITWLASLIIILFQVLALSRGKYESDLMQYNWLNFLLIFMQFSN